MCLFLNARVDQIVGKSPKADGEAGDDLSMMGRLVKVEKQVLIFIHMNNSMNNSIMFSLNHRVLLYMLVLTHSLTLTKEKIFAI